MVQRKGKVITHVRIILDEAVHYIMNTFYLLQITCSQKEKIGWWSVFKILNVKSTESYANREKESSL